MSSISISILLASGDPDKSDWRYWVFIAGGFAASLAGYNRAGLSLFLKRIRDAYSSYPSSETWLNNAPTTPTSEERSGQEDLCSKLESHRSAVQGW